MKKIFRLVGIIALAAIIGFGMLACGDGGGGDSGSGKYSGKDVLGNTYSLSVGSDARSALKGDNFNMVVNTRDGKTKTSKGVVTNVSADGTLTLQPDDGAAFVAVKSAGTITSVADAAGGFAEITYDDGTKFAPRTFDKIYLRATRWTNEEDNSSGEHYGSGLSILVKDFPTLVKEFKAVNPENYLVKICGISNKAISNLNIEVQGIKNDDSWFYIGGYAPSEKKSIKANENFYITVPLTTVKACNFSDFKEVLVQITDVKNYKKNNIAVVDNGSIPNNILDGYIVTTISKFGVGIFDSSAVTGNLGFYQFGIAEDGVSPNYNNAQWDFGWEKKSVLEIAQTNAGSKFVLEMTEKPTNKLLFAWSNPKKGEWWHETEIFNGTTWSSSCATWDEGTKKLTIKIKEAIEAGTGASKYNDFKNINVTNESEYTQFILYYGTDERDGILVLGIKSANITN